MSAVISRFQYNLYNTCVAIAAGIGLAILWRGDGVFSERLLDVMPILLLALAAIWHRIAGTQPSAVLRICTFAGFVWAMALFTGVVQI
jgi:hypothetical protein